MDYYNKYKQDYNAKPIVKGGKWLDVIVTHYATRERRTRALLNINSISDVQENYDPDKYGNNHWCKVSLENGSSYEVYATYDEMMDILSKHKTR